MSASRALVKIGNLSWVGYAWQVIFALIVSLGMLIALIWQIIMGVRMLQHG